MLCPHRSSVSRLDQEIFGVCFLSEARTGGHCPETLISLPLPSPVTTWFSPSLALLIPGRYFYNPIFVIFSSSHFLFYSLATWSEPFLICMQHAWLVQPIGDLYLKMRANIQQFEAQKYKCFLPPLLGTSAGCSVSTLSHTDIHIGRGRKHQPIQGLLGPLERICLAWTRIQGRFFLFFCVD